MHIDEILHAQRTVRLGQMPPGARILLSAGCAGGWYFDWVTEQYGEVEKHIGLEYYSPEPDVLPANVEWVKNTVSDMSSVADASVDLVFSGQNVEHLWLDDMVGFFLESHRVLRDDGVLVIDSPNRDLTREYRWSHPEHMIELNVQEARRAVELAGFEVLDTHGLWECRRDGVVLPLGGSDDDLIERAMRAPGRPENSFIWWIEAAKRRSPMPEELRAFLAEIFAAEWPERISRFVSNAGDPMPGGRRFSSRTNHAGGVIFGPYFALPQGTYEVDFEIVGQDAMSESPGFVDVMADEEVLATTHIPPLSPDQSFSTTVRFDVVGDIAFGVQFRVLSHGRFRFVATEPTGLRQISGSPDYPGTRLGVS